MIRAPFAVAALALAGAVAVAAPASAATKPKTYANCTAMNKVYPHGVGRKGARDKVSGSAKPVTNFRVDTALYNANTKSDRDKDGVACEKR
jgi:excalibur calcium-binding domain-containing protein